MAIILMKNISYGSSGGLVQRLPERHEKTEVPVPRENIPGKTSGRVFPTAILGRNNRGAGSLASPLVREVRET